MNEKRVVLDKTLCIGIRKEKRKSRVEKRNCFIRLQLLFFIWHLFHYLLFPDDSIMSSLFLLPKCFTECAACLLAIMDNLTFSAHFHMI